MIASSTKSPKKAFGTASMLRARDFVGRGVPRWRLLQAERSGEIVRLSRGLYGLPEMEVSENHALALVARQAPQAAVCLLSALRYQNLTTANPHEVWIAIDRKARKPTINYPVVRVVWFSPDTFELGLEKHQIEGIGVQIYSVARTVVDLFRYRNKIGMDVAMEALKEGWRDRRFTLREINEIAGKLRMTTIMRPYLEILVAS